MRNIIQKPYDYKSWRTSYLCRPLCFSRSSGAFGLTHRINKEGSIFGQLFFLEADAEMYDIEHDKYVVIHVPAKTIVVDPRMYLFRNLGSVNNTIIHECVHWIKHRKVFMLEKLYNEKIQELPVRLSEGQEQICPSRQQRKWNSKLTD